jgi:subtilisin family serine protease
MARGWNRDAEVALPPVIVHAVRDREARRRHAAEAREERLRWAETLLRLPLVWRETRGEGIKVAILDTGIDADHPDLEGAVVEARDFTGEGIEDRNGHGTHCAGIVAARANGVGFVGAAPECELVVAKVLDGEGRGKLSQLVAGIDWAVEVGADILSLSLAAEADDRELHRAVHAALAAGRIVVCAAGNNGALGANTIGYPGRYGSVVTVAAHDAMGHPSGFSSRGPEIDFMAPGQEIWSTWKEGGWAQLSGTSMAAPFVAGLAALVLAKHRKPGRHATPILDNQDLKEHLLRMAAHPGWHDPARGHGPLLPFAYFLADARPLVEARAVRRGRGRQVGSLERDAKRRRAN